LSPVSGAAARSAWEGVSFALEWKGDLDVPRWRMKNHGGGGLGVTGIGMEIGINFDCDAWFRWDDC
jgi:hypothetical protein